MAKLNRVQFLLKPGFVAELFVNPKAIPRLMYETRPGKVHEIQFGIKHGMKLVEFDTYRRTSKNGVVRIFGNVITIKEPT